MTFLRGVLLDLSLGVQLCSTRDVFFLGQDKEEHAHYQFFALMNFELRTVEPEAWEPISATDGVVSVLRRLGPYIPHVRYFEVMVFKSFTSFRPFIFHMGHF